MADQPNVYAPPSAEEAPNAPEATPEPRAVIRVAVGRGWSQPCPRCKGQQLEFCDPPAEPMVGRFARALTPRGSWARCLECRAVFGAKTGTIPNHRNAWLAMILMLVVVVGGMALADLIRDCGLQAP